MNITAKELSGQHIGKTVTICRKNGKPWRQGQIKDIMHDSEHTHIDLENAIHLLTMPNGTPITIQEGQ